MLCVRCVLTLRTQQIDYLEYLAERDDTNLSRAFGRIIERKIVVQPPTEQARASRKLRKTLTLLPSHLEMIDQMSESLGLPRSDIARRLIDEALAKDSTI